MDPCCLHVFQRIFTAYIYRTFIFRFLIFMIRIPEKKTSRLNTVKCIIRTNFRGSVVIIVTFYDTVNLVETFTLSNISVSHYASLSILMVVASCYAVLPLCVRPSVLKP